MRQIDSGLGKFFKTFAANFIQQQSNYDGYRKLKYQTKETKEKRISENTVKIIYIEHIYEVFKSYPVAA